MYADYTHSENCGKTHSLITQEQLHQLAIGKAIQADHDKRRSSISGALSKGAALEPGKLAAELVLIQQPPTYETVARLLSRNDRHLLDTAVPVLRKSCLLLPKPLLTALLPEDELTEKQIQQSVIANYISQVDKCQEYSLLRREIIHRFESGAKVERGKFQLTIGYRKYRQLEPAVAINVLGESHWEGVLAAIGPIWRRCLVVTDTHAGNLIGWHAHWQCYSAN